MSLLMLNRVTGVLKRGVAEHAEIRRAIEAKQRSCFEDRVLAGFCGFGAMSPKSYGSKWTLIPNGRRHLAQAANAELNTVTTQRLGTRHCSFFDLEASVRYIPVLVNLYEGDPNHSAFLRFPSESSLRSIVLQAGFRALDLF